MDYTHVLARKFSLVFYLSRNDGFAFLILSNVFFSMERACFWHSRSGIFQVSLLKEGGNSACIDCTMSIFSARDICEGETVLMLSEDTMKSSLSSVSMTLLSIKFSSRLWSKWSAAAFSKASRLPYNSSADFCNDSFVLERARGSLSSKADLVPFWKVMT